MDINEKFVITINRELGSGGHTVGEKLAQKLGVKYYDKAQIEGLTEKFGLSVEEIERIKRQKKSWWTTFNEFYDKCFSLHLSADQDEKPTTAAMFETERRILEELAHEESCVVAGRSAFLVFREWPNHLNVFIQASMGYRLQRIMKKQKVSLGKAQDIIDEVDEGRENYLNNYSSRSRYDTRNYQLVISMDEMTEDGAVDVIMAYIKAMSGC